MSEEKKLSSTDVYKNHLQAIIYQELGVKVSRDKAWKLFKAIILGTVQHVAKIDGNKLSLAGIGSFEIIKSTPRGSKAGLDKDGNPIPGATPWPFVPRMRWYTSSVVDSNVESMFGLGDNPDAELTNYGLYKTDAAAPAAEVVEEVVEEVAEVAAPVVETTADDDFFNL